MQTKAKLEEKRAQLHGGVDATTGRPLYQPKVGRAPRPEGQGPRNPEGLPVGVHLYQCAVESQRRQQAAAEAEKEADRAAASQAHATGERARTRTPAPAVRRCPPLTNRCAALLTRGSCPRPCSRSQEQQAV